MADVALTGGTGRRAFGADAERYARRLPADTDAIVADRGGAAAALAAAVERRRQGRPFYVAPLVDDPRALASLALSGSLFAAAGDVDRRRAWFDALADDRWYAGLRAEPEPNVEDGERIDERARYVLGLDRGAHDGAALFTRMRARFSAAAGVPAPATATEAQRRVLRDLVSAGDALLARSWYDARRIAEQLRSKTSVAIAPGRDTGVPRVLRERGARGPLVVWAPDWDASYLGVIACALAERTGETLYVCASGELAGARGTFVRPEQGAAALAHASLVVDASPTDPGIALALAELDVPLCYAATTGAAEHVAGGVAYLPWDWRTLHAAVSAAPASLRPAAEPYVVPVERLAATLASTAAPVPRREPLVSVLIPTFNRTRMLDVALDSLARQSYRRIEALVVNNGTASVAEIVAAYPFVRLIENETNIGVPAFFVQAMNAMRGEYFCVLSDDDIDFPDFLARLVAALESSGAAVAHGNTVTRYFTGGDGDDRTVAYRVRSDRALDPLTIRCGATMTLQSMLFRRSVVADIGGMDPTLGPCDLDFQIRAAERFDFVHVDAVTCCWNSALDAASFNTSDELVRGMRRLYERYPARGSALVERMRERERARFERRGATALWAPDLVLDSADGADR